MKALLRCVMVVTILLASLGSHAQSFFASKEPLPPEQAFRFTATREADAIALQWQIAPGYYLYRSKFAFSANGGKLGEPAFPAGEWKDDETFGRVETYRDTLFIRIPLSQAPDVVTVQATYQGCADLGVCYPPLTANETLPAMSATSGTAGTGSAARQSESGSIASMLSKGSLWLNLATFFGFGLLLAFTPCMLPMVPILSGIIVGHGHSISHGRAFVLSSVYGLGMALTYALAGVAAGLSGNLLSAALQNVWALSAFALVFVVLALAMFGLYELQLPASLQSRVSSTANRQGGSLRGIALMGALSAIIVGPCVAAPLAGALLYIAQTRDAVLGGAALFAMALGMGLPLVAVGTFSRTLLPKTGPWMETVKKFFGVVLLATALWLLRPVLPNLVWMLGWALLCIIPAIYVRAIDPLPPHAGSAARVIKAIGLVLLLWGAAILVGAWGGARDPLQPLKFLQVGQRPHIELPFRAIRTVSELEAALIAAQNTQAPVLLDFYADWCVSCIEMEEKTFSDGGIAAQMKQFTLLRVDVTANTADDAALLKRFGLFGPPGIIFFGRDGKERLALRLVGFKSATEFSPLLKQALE